MATANFWGNAKSPADDWELAQQQAKRQQAIADALRQQSQAPLQGGMAGRVYVGPSWTQGLAKLLQAYTAGQIGKDSDKQLRAAKDENTQRSQQGMASIVDALSGKPAQQFDIPANEMDSEATTGMSAEQKPDMNRALALAMQSQDPALQQFGLRGMAQMPEIKARQEERTADRTFRAEQATDARSAKAEAAALANQARVEQMQQAHQLRMDAMTAQNASRGQMADAQREFQRQQMGMQQEFQREMKKIGGAGGAQPYFQPVQTAQGVFAFNARTGKVEPVTGADGKSIVGAVADPQLQGTISGAKEGAKADVEKGVEAGKAVKRSDAMLSQINTAENILKAGKATQSGAGALVDRAGRLVGVSNLGAQESAKLEALSGWLVSNIPRMEGPQSNFDVQNYQLMAGKIGDKTVPIPERLAAIGEVRKLQEKYKAVNSGSQQSSPVTPKRIRLDAQGNIIP